MKKAAEFLPGSHSQLAAQMERQARECPDTYPLPGQSVQEGLNWAVCPVPLVSRGERELPLTALKEITIFLPCICCNHADPLFIML